MDAVLQALTSRLQQAGIDPATSQLLERTVVRLGAFGVSTGYRRYLTLPGINPSVRLMTRVEAPVLLDAVDVPEPQEFQALGSAEKK